MNLQVLMATTDLKLTEDCPKGLDQLGENKIKCTVVNQVEILKNDSFSLYQDIDVFNFSEKGLSKSRNRNLATISEKICLITDQDILFKQGFQHSILSAFKDSPKADIIAFQMEDLSGNPLKKYKGQSFWMNQRAIMKVSSVEIAFKSASILNNNLSFDENFGLGTSFPTGEEAIFLSDALKKGLRIKYVPISIVQHPKESSGYNYMNNDSLIRAKGAMLFRIFGPKAYLISIVFALKKFKLSSRSFLKFTQLMFDGISTYKRRKHD